MFPERRGNFLVPHYPIFAFHRQVLLLLPPRRAKADRFIGRAMIRNVPRGRAIHADGEVW
jgi:hypothetical protein